jgi:hypothetical protein
VGAMELSVLKFDFFKILTDHECFIPINLPLPYELQPADISFEVQIDLHPKLKSSNRLSQFTLTRCMCRVVCRRANGRR